jgi:hypothetical protein
LSISLIPEPVEKLEERESRELLSRENGGLEPRARRRDA